MDETQAEFMNCLSNFNMQEIYVFLAKRQVKNIIQIRDKEGYTVLHTLARYNKGNVLESLLRYCKELYGPSYQKEAEVWVNLKTYEEELTCAHIAISNGNLEMINIFLTLGADMNQKNKYGMTAMHIAAKNDQMLIMAWLRNQGHEADAKDSLNNTPLHYSCLFKCEFATAVLLSWEVSVNSTNDNKETPLFMAVQSDSFRIVRSLLIKGAQVDLENTEGKTPLSLALAKKNREIVNLIKPPDLLSLCGIKSPQRPVRFKRVLMFIYVLLLASGIYSMYFVLGTDDVYYNILTGLEVALLVMACLKDPGYLAKNHEHLLFNLAKNIDFYHICPQCVRARLPRSRHCQTCNKCVEKFDHHCPWINNCIGGRNLGVFYMFITVTLLFLCYTCYLGVSFFLYTLNENGPFFSYKLGIACFWSLVSLSFIGPLSLLICVQSRNFVSNTTTNERYSRVVHPHKVERSESDEQVSRSSTLRNIIEMCCNTQSQDYKYRKTTASSYQLIDSSELKERLIN